MICSKTDKKCPAALLAKALTTVDATSPIQSPNYPEPSRSSATNLDCGRRAQRRHRFRTSLVVEVKKAEIHSQRVAEPIWWRWDGERFQPLTANEVSKAGVGPGSHDAHQRQHWSKRQRQTIFRLLLQQFGEMIGKTKVGSHPAPATLWRVTVESWLRGQGLITVRQNHQPNVSTTFAKCWSHN